MKHDSAALPDAGRHTIGVLAQRGHPMPRIPFSDVTFPNQGASTRYEVENRLKQFIVDYRKNACALGNVYPVTEKARATTAQLTDQSAAHHTPADGSHRALCTDEPPLAAS
ncbi:MAG: hypothetical protein ACSHWX_17415 [Maritalea sp.]